MAIETPEYLKFAQRIIRAAGRRTGDADEYELAMLLDLQRVLDEAIQTAVTGQRAIGRSWAAIALGTGTSRQAAQQRWGKVEKDDQMPPPMFELEGAGK